MSAETILKMIESVDPADTATMDEIDARVACYLDGWEFKEYFRLYNCDGTQAFSLDEKETLFCPHYTRSRDALKAIRPDGWEFQADVRFACDIKPSGVLYRFWAMLPDWAKWNPVDNSWIRSLKSHLLQTEELAELHAIIQAIEYERRKNDR